MRQRKANIDDSALSPYAARFTATRPRVWTPVFSRNPDFHRPFNRPQDNARQTRDMANTPQARKRIRRNNARAEVNTARISRIRSFIKKVEAACEAGDKDAAATALKAAQPEMARGVARGVLHKNTVARKLSRLTKRVAAL